MKKPILFISFILLVVAIAFCGCSLNKDTLSDSNFILSNISNVENFSVVENDYQIKAGTFTYRYDANGGKLSESRWGTDRTEDNSTSYTLNTTICERTNYKFIGWYNNAECTGNEIKSLPRGTTGSFVFYAKWQAVAFTYRYDANGGKLSESRWGTDRTEDNSTSYTLNTTICERANYKFIGWYNNAECTGNEIVSLPKGTTGSFVFYAKWLPITYTYNYNANGGTITETRWKITQTCENTSELILPQSEAVTRQNYEFAGWYYNAECTGDEVKRVPVGTTGTFTFYAKWNPITFTYRYDANGGKLSESRWGTDRTEDNTTSYTLNTAICERANYKFIGWYNNAECTGNEIVSLPKGTTGSFVFYAKWLPISYTYNYNANGGTITETRWKITQTRENTSELILPQSEAVTRQNYDFEGWYYNAECTGKEVKKIPVGTLGTFTLYAKWKIQEFPVEVYFYHFSTTKPHESKRATSIGTTKLSYLNDGAILKDVFLTLFSGFKTYFDQFQYVYPVFYDGDVDGGKEITTIVLDNYKVPYNPFNVKEIYIRLLPIQFNLVFHSNGGILDNWTSQISYNYYDGSSSAFGAFPIKKNFEFLGWYDNPAFTGEEIKNIPSGKNGSIDLYAKFKEFGNLILYVGDTVLEPFYNETIKVGDNPFPIDLKGYFDLNWKDKGKWDVQGKYAYYSFVGWSKTEINNLGWGQLKDFEKDVSLINTNFYSQSTERTILYAVMKFEYNVFDDQKAGYTTGAITTKTTFKIPDKPILGDGGKVDNSVDKVVKGVSFWSNLVKMFSGKISFLEFANMYKWIWIVISVLAVILFFLLFPLWKVLFSIILMPFKIIYRNIKSITKNSKSS